MRKPVRMPLALAAVALSLLGLGAGAQTAAAATHYIHMSAPARIAEGESALINIDGVVAPPEEFWDESWIEVVALPADLTPLCPGDAQSAGNVAEEAGNILAIAQHPNADAAGNFANSVAVRAGSAGSVLICGYLYNGEGQTWAAAGLKIEVVPASAGGGGGGGAGPHGGAKPVNVRKPWVTYTGRRLVCHRGAWSNAHSFTYSWYLDGSVRRTRSRRPYAPIEALRGHRASCLVTAHSRDGVTSIKSPTIRLR